jgi:hypothetical protein
MTMDTPDFFAAVPCIRLRDPLAAFLGVAGVVANVASLLTGAAGMGGFKGLGGRFDRRTLLACTPPHRYMFCPALESP